MPIFTEDLETKFTLEQSANPIPEDAPFHLLLIGDWSGKKERVGASARPVFIDRDNFEEVMRRLETGVSLDLQGDGQDVLELRFEELDDFHPDKIFHQVPLFSDLRNTRRRLMSDGTFELAAREVRSWIGSNSEPGAENPTEEAAEPPPSSGNLLDDILAGGGTAVPARKSEASSSSELNSLISRLVSPYLITTDTAEQSKLVSAVDNATGELMRQILHHPDFRALEAAWRGVNLVISRVETDNNLKVYLLDVTKDEFTGDLKGTGNLSDSAFSRVLNERSPSVRNDEGFAAVCANYAFKSNVDDIATLMRVAEISKKANTPFIAQGEPQIIGLESVTDFAETRTLALSENTAEGKLWNMLRELDEAAYLGLTTPRLMARLPYGKYSDPTENFSFEEITAENRHDQYLWSNASFAAALLLAQSFSMYEWEMGGNLLTDLEGLPMYIHQDDRTTFVKPCAETVLTLSAAEQIMNEGLMLFISYRDSDKVRLARFQSIASPSRRLQGKW